MASLIGRAIRLAKSPQGKKLIAEAQKAARDPKNKQRVEKVRQRFTQRWRASVRLSVVASRIAVITAHSESELKIYAQEPEGTLRG